MADEETKNKGVDYPYIYGIPDTTTVTLHECATDSLDDQLFDHEKEALQEAKGWEVSENFSDQFIVSCLFARKFDMRRVENMLDDALQYRNSLGMIEWPTYDSIEKILLFNQSYYSVPGARAKDGCGIIYMTMKKMVTKNDVDFELTDAMIRLMMFNSQIGMFIDGFKYLLLIV